MEEESCCCAEIAAAGFLDFLRIDVELESKPRVLQGERMSCWERRLRQEKSQRKEEKQRKKLKRPNKDVNELQLSKHIIKALTKARLEDARGAGPGLCVDLSMTNCLSAKEISRLACQIRRLYGCIHSPGFIAYDSLAHTVSKALEYVEEDKVYILGGLVDETIQKKISYTRAKELCVCTERLLIDEYMVKRPNPKNDHSKILAINQVFEILKTGLKRLPLEYLQEKLTWWSQQHLQT